MNFGNYFVSILTLYFKSISAENNWVNSNGSGLNSIWELIIVGNIIIGDLMVIFI